MYNTRYSSKSYLFCSAKTAFSRNNGVFAIG